MTFTHKKIKIFKNICNQTKGERAVSGIGKNPINLYRNIQRYSKKAKHKKLLSEFRLKEQKMSKLIMEKSDVIAVEIDFQKIVCQPVWQREKTENNIVKLITGLRILDIPILVSEQYPKGLGETTDLIASALGKYTPIEKTTFSCLNTEAFAAALEATGRKTVVIAGIEAHVCVMHTVLHLLESGYQVHVAADCITSRQEIDKEIALRRMENAGAVITTWETVLFELMGSSKAPEFREIQKKLFM